MSPGPLRCRCGLWRKPRTATASSATDDSIPELRFELAAFSQPLDYRSDGTRRGHMPARHPPATNGNDGEKQEARRLRLS